MFSKDNFVLNYNNPLTRGIVACYPFNHKGGNLLRDSFDKGRANPGILTGCQWRPNGLYFNGVADKITIPHSSLTSFGSGDFSISAWVYFSGSITDRMIYYKFNNTSTIGYALRYKVAGNVGFEFYPYNTNITANPVNEGFLSAQLNTWYHIVGVRSNGNLYLYRNGVKVGGPVANTSNVNNTLSGYVGASLIDWYGNQLNGLVGGLIQYNRALNSNEVAQLYQNPSSIFRFRKLNLPVFLDIGFVPVIDQNLPIGVFLLGERNIEWESNSRNTGWKSNIRDLKWPFDQKYIGWILPQEVEKWSLNSSTKEWVLNNKNEWIL